MRKNRKSADPNYSFNEKISAFALIELNSYLYFGLGVKYNFKIKRE